MGGDFGHFQPVGLPVGAEDRCEGIVLPLIGVETEADGCFRRLAQRGGFLSR